MTYTQKFILSISSVFLLLGCSDIIEVPDISEESVVIIAPANEAIIQSNITIFTWEAVENANDYVLQVAKPNFANAAQVLVDSTMSATTFSKELSPGVYEWRIKAINSGYETIYSINKFTVAEGEGLASNTLILTAPNNNFITNETAITLSWNDLTDATEYRVQVLDAADESVLDETLKVTSIDATFTEGDFTWKVRAQNNTESTLYSSRNLTVDTTIPNTPLLVTPTNNSTASAGSIDFTWTREAIAGSEEIDSIYIYTDVTLETLFLKDVGDNKSFSTNLQANTYYWNVKAFDKAGNESELSTTFNLTIN